MYRIIIDNQSLITDIADEESYAYKIVEDAIAKKIQPIISSALLEEAENLADEQIDDSDVFDLLEEYYKTCEELEPRAKASVVDDEKVNELVATAEAGDADFIITENSELLDLDEYKSIRMLTPEQFWNMYQEDEEEETEDSNWA
jgi:predicted nucleic acid-binding protein